MLKKLLIGSLLFMGGAVAHAQMQYGVTPIPTICMPTHPLILKHYQEDWKLTLYGNDTAEEDVVFYIFRRKGELFIVKEYQQAGVSCMLGYADDAEVFEDPPGNPT